MTKQRKPHSIVKGFQRIFSGCLAVIASFFLLLVAIFIIFEVKLEGLAVLVILISGIGLAIYFWKKLFTKLESNSHGLKIIFFDTIKLIFMIIVFGLVVERVAKSSGYDFERDKEEELFDKEENKREIITETSGTDQVTKYYVNRRVWRDFDGYNRKVNLKISHDDVENSHDNRVSYRITSNFFWGDFYKNMADHDKPLLEHTFEAFQKLQDQHQFSRRKFAEVIISCIQNIPYHYIKTKPCQGNEDYPCVGSIKLGIFAPAEFSANLTGDCDSRTVLLFSLLSRFNYDVAILNSDHYRHSILGIHIPGRGKYKIFKRKKYYLVETTAKGCPIGFLAAQVSNLKYWKFVLVNSQTK